MNTIIFKQRLVNILNLKKKITREDLIKTLRVFWFHSKPKVDPIFIYQCYYILKDLISTFDLLIENSNRRYYYIYNKTLISNVF